MSHSCIGSSLLISFILINYFRDLPAYITWLTYPINFQPMHVRLLQGFFEPTYCSLATPIQIPTLPTNRIGHYMYMKHAIVLRLIVTVT